MTIYVDLPRERQDPIKLADWMEVNALVDEDASCSLDDLTSRLKIEVDSSNRDGGKLESFRAEVSREILARYRELGNAYPFKLSENLLSVTDTKRLSNYQAYLFCLIVSFVGLERGARILKLWKIQEATCTFEEMCTFAARNFISCREVQAKAVKFGAPRRDWKHEHRSFTKALPRLKELLEEGAIKPNVTTPRRKDAGLDVVAWRRFPDGKMSNLFLLGQCAAGNDFMSKKRDLMEFAAYYALDVGVVHSFFVPHLFDEQDWQGLYFKEVGIVFDRRRITIFASKWRTTNFNALLKTTRGALRAKGTKL